MLENDKKLSFYSLDRIFALSFNKISGISAIKMNEFILYCSRFALSFNKISGISAIKMNEFILYCSRFALSLCHTKRKSMKRFIHIILTLTAIAIACTAEMQAQNDMITVRYSTDDGLPSNTVYTTLKSKDGFMWFGTWYGLSSFDGTEFTPYVIRRNQKSDIPPRKVINMVEDRRNNIWIRTVCTVLTKQRNASTICTPN